MLKKKYAFTAGTSSKPSDAEDTDFSEYRFASSSRQYKDFAVDDAQTDDEGKDEEDVVSKYFSQRSTGSTQPSSQKSQKDDTWLFKSNSEDDVESDRRSANKERERASFSFAETKSLGNGTDVHRRFDNLKKLAATSASVARQHEEETGQGQYWKKRVSHDESSTFKDDRSSTVSLVRTQAKRIRPKPDLGSEEPDNDIDEDQEVSRPKGQVVLRPTVARAPAKELPIRVLKRQRELARLAALDDESERRKLLEQKKQELRDLEQRRLNDKYWMKDFLQGAKRSVDDRGLSGKAVLRKEYLQDGAEQHSTGKNLYHNQFLAQPNAVAGRFFVEPMGNKPTELNGEDTSLYLFVEKTGSEGFTLRVDRKYYELFEGDVGIVPPDAAYSFVNPSKIASCQFTYMLIPTIAPPSAPVRSSVPGANTGAIQERNDEESEINEEDLFSYDFRGVKGLAAGKKDSRTDTSVGAT